MLPLEETPFAINANTRTISNPKITIVQNDQNAEVIMFTIDRYFDYKDLDRALIYVQWTLPDGVTEGATAVEMKDLSIPGKIRFGWPLDSEITSQPGNVKFSVRFWNSGRIKDENGVEKDAVVYSLNTLTSTLYINAALQPELNDGTQVNAPISDGYFKKAIINSQLTGEGIAVPLNPRFDDPGLNLYQHESLSAVLDEEQKPTYVDGKPVETLTLKAQAITSDTGTITYEWWYKPAEDSEDGTFNSSTWYAFNDSVDEDGNTIKGFRHYGGVVDNEVYEEANTSNGLVMNEKYYMVKNDEYVAYDGSTPVPQLYERFTTYTVPSDANVHVTGQYQVKATNTISPNVSTAVGSRVCELVSPDEVVFMPNGNLQPRAIFEVDADKNIKPLDLSVKVVADDSVATKRSFTWSKYISNKDGAIAENSETITSGTYQVVTPGWYQVVINSTLNRETKTATSVKCKVTAMPTIPTMDYTAAAKALIPSGKTIPYYTEDKAELEVVLGDIVPAAYNGYDEELFSENINYVWGFQKDNESFRYLTEKDVESGFVSELGKSKLIVNSPGNDGYTFYCIVTNTLNNKTVECAREEALAFYIV